ncbi:histone deacetylase 6 [Plakobranchus ocellatus]|uniref:Histone deacetylase 6 n=1 Tax=Plakobranchus ocellatus TaxID=259542 RepID=A0AAV4BNV3_9GAST|nr:histone deacetylase 6 [Plakobranchus ocellatus]
MFAVTPLTWCPHLTEVRPVPREGLNSSEPCGTCGDPTENWVCLTCYKVECSRFVNEHMLYHRLETEHNMVLSYSDISVWCYCCDQYVDNPALREVKNAAHRSKFGEALPGMS